MCLAFTFLFSNAIRPASVDMLWDLAHALDASVLATVDDVRAPLSRSWSFEGRYLHSVFNGRMISRKALF